jgi:hypothetical protein
MSALKAESVNISSKALSESIVKANANGWTPMREINSIE